MSKTLSIGRNETSRRIIRAVLIASLLLLFTLVTPVIAEESPVLDAAQSFLGLLDGGSFTQAWWEGSELLQLTNNLDTWVEKQRVTRELMGKLEERAVKNVAQRSTISSLPDGDYRILVVSSRFERKERSYEVLVLTKVPYGEWRVVSYNLR